GQNWARQDAVFPVDDGKLTGRVRDLQSCFNLNSLSVPLKDGVSGDDLEKQPYQVKAFRALLKQLEVEDYEAVQLTDAIRDWTDKDTALVSSYGAEDAYYEGLTPPYLTANQWMISTDELRAVRGVSAKLYARLAPYVCALPTDKLVVNINTIKPEQATLLVALYQDKIGLDDAKRVLTSRPQKGWKDKKAMTDQMPVQVSTIQGLDAALDVKSSYFEAKLIAEVGDTRARLESVFVRGKDNKLVMLRRLSGGAE
ncbi:MAG: GspK family T2SS minor pseudopilin variant ExeK, partial [Aeromonas sp.]|nr:GspK family T2SS minor pseudopilin variant ExeK [Aeromonas sp.]